jgi:hypothetical protein
MIALDELTSQQTVMLGQRLGQRPLPKG